MTWNNAAEFFAMGGYGLYVWGSYIACALCMFIEPVLARQRHRQALRSAAQQQAQDRQDLARDPLAET